jgi:hypothetical protein
VPPLLLKSPVPESWMSIGWIAAMTPLRSERFHLLDRPSTQMFRLRMRPA